MRNLIAAITALAVTANCGSRHLATPSAPAERVVAACSTAVSWSDGAAQPFLNAPAQVYVEPDHILRRSGSLTVLGRAGFVRRTGDSGLEPIAGVRLDDDGHLSPIRPTETWSAAPDVLTGAFGPHGELQLLLGHQVAGTMRVSLRAGSGLTRSAIVDLGAVRAAHLVTTGVSSDESTEYLLVPTVPQRSLVRVRAIGTRLAIDTLTLPGTPEFLVPFERPRGRPSRVAFNTIRFADGRYRLPAILVADLLPDRGVDGVRVLQESVDASPGQVVIAQSHDTIALVWTETRQGDVRPTRLGGSVSTDGGERWRSIPRLSIPSGAFGLDAAWHGHDSLVIAVREGPRLQNVSVAMLSSGGWSTLLPAITAPSVSAPVLMPGPRNRLRVVAGVSADPRSELPSLVQRTGEWRCVHRARE